MSVKDQCVQLINGFDEDFLTSVHQSLSALKVMYEKARHNAEYSAMLNESMVQIEMGKCKAHDIIEVSDE
jgi:hypothetical protein